jgi:hypothetical protein
MENVAPIITAIGAMLAIFGAGAKWLIGYLDKKAAAAAAREDAARKALADRFKSEIDQLRREVETLTKQNKIYLRHIYQLENLAHTHSLPLPITEGWPP